MLYVCKRTRFSYKFYVAVLLAMAVVVRGLLLLLFSLNESQHSHFIHNTFRFLFFSVFFLCSLTKREMVSFDSCNFYHDSDKVLYRIIERDLMTNEDWFDLLTGVIDRKAKKTSKLQYS